MSENRLIQAVAVAALLIALALGYGANRSISELRDKQVELAREIRALKEASESWFSSASMGGRDVARESGDSPPGEKPISIAPSEVEDLRRRLADVEAGNRLDSARVEKIDRVALLKGKARANALEDLEFLVSLGDDDARSVVLGALLDADPRVRKSALGVIAKAGDPELIADLEPLVKDPSRDVRQELAESLEDASAEHAGPLLMRLLDDQDPEVVEDAVKSLGAIGYDDASDRIAELVDPWNPELTGAVGEAMRDFGDVSGMEAAIEALIPALEHEDPAIRQRAVKEIGQIGGPSARAYLESALEDEDYEVKREARKRIAKL